jgi:DNA-binding transcriptional MerR regulator
MEDIQKKLESLPDKTYFRIGEVARIIKVKPYVLRFWESEFKIMAPPKSRSKQRMYRKKDIETILRIKQLLYAERFTIEGARKRLSADRREDAGESPRSAPAKAPAGKIPSGELRRVRAELEKIQELLGGDVG